MKPLSRIAIAAFIAALGLPSSQALATAGGQIGVLSCKSVPGSGVNFLIHSSVKTSCVFRMPQGEERYDGEMGIGLGVDLNWNRNETIHFGVIAGVADMTVGSYSLSGRYVGGRGSFTAAIGTGAAVLVGGGSGNISLQPIGLEGSTGWGVAGGLGYLYLDPEK